MLANFWTMNPGGTWPPIAVVFGFTIISLIAFAYRDHLIDNNEIHYHEDKKGVLHKCYHSCKDQNLLFSKWYWIALTVGFPLEHIVWHKLYPFYLLSNWLNIG